MKISKNKIMIAVIIALCAVVAGLVIYMVVGKNNKNNNNDNAFTPSLDANAGDSNSDKATTGSQQSIRIPGYPSITIAAGKEDVTMNLMNPEGNPCYFTFEIVLSDTGESIYKSAMVEPGKAISNVKLNHSLSAGEYKAAIKISTSSLTDGTAMNGANVETTIVAK